MNAVITGGRDYVMTEADFRFLETMVARLGVTQVTTGGARGVDAQAETWARRRGISTRRIEPDWARDGKAAGFRRNTTLANMADAVIAFPGGNGTRDMVAKARWRDVPVHESPSRQSATTPTPAPVLDPLPLFPWERQPATASKPAGRLRNTPTVRTVPVASKPRAIRP